MLSPRDGRLWVIGAAFLFAAGTLVCTQPTHASEEEEQEDRQRLAVFLDVLPGGSAEKAMIEYNQWRKSGGDRIPLDKPFTDLVEADQWKVRDLMERMYTAAGEGHDSFKTVALLLDKGLANPSEQFTKDGHSAEKINDKLSVLMAQARDHWIEKAIEKVVTGRKPAMKIGRSDSGNTTSGMKSDLDQTFYVYEWTRRRATGKRR